MPKSSIRASIGNYAVLPITKPPTPSYQVSATHYIYLRAHTPKIPSQTDERSLFIVNVPIDSTEAHFRAIFNSLLGAGRFEKITFENERSKHPTAPSESEFLRMLNSKKGKKRKRNNGDADLDEDAGELPKVWDRELRRSGSTAVVILVDEKSVEGALKAVKKVHKSRDYPIWGESVDERKIPPLGSKRYATHHALRYPDPAALQASVDTFMSAFNAREEEAARLGKRQRNVPDEDGFVTVVRGGGRTGPARKEEAEERRAKEVEKEEKKKREMGDFYRFQMRERRKEEQGELVRRFDEDRRRVEVMKEKRGKFRPE